MLISLWVHAATLWLDGLLKVAPQFCLFHNLEERGGKKMRLKALVIDDSRIMRKMVMESLAQTDVATFSFTEALDGADGLAKFDPSQIDILFVDWNMPNLSGIDLVRKIRSMPNTGHIPIIMVTSEKTMGRITDALDSAGANEYICKPFTVDEMTRKLKPLVAEIIKRQSGGKTSEKSSGFFSKLTG